MVAPYARTKLIPAERVSTSTLYPVTNAVESLPKIIKTRGSSPTDETALKLVFLDDPQCWGALAPAY
jgi:Cu/Ag efflux pump CusA